MRLGDLNGAVVELRHGLHLQVVPEHSHLSLARHIPIEILQGGVWGVGFGIWGSGFGVKG